MPAKLVERDSVVVHQHTNRAARYLTSEETIEVARIQKTPNVIGYALITMDGTQIEASGAFKDVLGPVMANIFQVTALLGQEFGERETTPMVLLESPDYEVAAVQLTRVRAIFIKRRERNATDVLHSIA